MEAKVSVFGHFQRKTFTAGLVENVFGLRIQVDDKILTYMLPRTLLPLMENIS